MCKCKSVFVVLVVIRVCVYAAIAKFNTNATTKTLNKKIMFPL